MRLLFDSELTFVTGGLSDESGMSADGGDGSGSGSGGPAGIYSHAGERSATTDRNLQLLERSTNMFSGFSSCSYSDDNTITCNQVSSPTDDQITFHNNSEEVSSNLWSLSGDQQSAIASSLTDVGVDISQTNLNLTQEYQDYGTWSDHQGTAQGFAEFVALDQIIGDLSSAFWPDAGGGGDSGGSGSFGMENAFFEDDESVDTLDW